MRSSAFASRRSRVVAPIAVSMTALALIAAGCGGSEKKDAPAAAPAGVANYIPASALMYAEISTDFKGAQWQQLDTLAKTFPAYPEMRKQIDEELNSGDVKFETDVKPLLGERAAIGVLDIPTDKATAMATSSVPADPNALASAADEGRFVMAVELAEGKEADAEKVLAKSVKGAAPTKDGDLTIYTEDKKSFATVVPGAILFGTSVADLKAAVAAKNAGGGSTIAGNARYTDTIGKLPDQMFAQGYVDLGAIMQKQVAANPQLQAQAKAFETYKDMRMATSAAAETEGVRVKGVTVGGPEAPEGTSFTPSLNAKVPSTALVYMGFQNLQAQVGQSLEQYAASGANPQMVEQANAVSGQLQSMLGVSLEDLKAITTKEHALVVTGGAPYPNVALALQVDDGARATKTLDALRTASPALLSQANLPNRNAQWGQVPLEGGVTGWQLPVSDSGSVVYGVDGNLALIGSSPAVLKQIQRPASPLSTSEPYTKALSGMPEQVTSVLWVNVGEAVRFGEAMGAFKDPEGQKAVANLRRVASISGWTTGGKDQTFEVFVRLAS